MAILLSIQDLSKTYGPRPLFDGLSFGLSDGERAGLIGPNGSGKSTLMRILSGADEPDQGKVVARRGLRLGFLAQNDIFAGRTESALDALQNSFDQGHWDEPERRRRALAALDAADFSEPKKPAGK
ncbi:MAG: ATP-binding cassette domain-containing protein, partial [bacterium]